MYVGATVRIKGDEDRQTYYGTIFWVYDGVAFIRWSDGYKDDQGNKWPLEDLVEVEA